MYVSMATSCECVRDGPEPNAPTRSQHTQQELAHGLQMSEEAKALIASRLHFWRVARTTPISASAWRRSESGFLSSAYGSCARGS
jgi:hypothetical protein